MNPEGANPEAASELAPAIQEALAVLARGAESVRAVMQSEDNRFARALDDLRRLAIAEGIPIAIVGGLGAIRYGYPAATQDIDVAVGMERLETLIGVAPRYGFRVAWKSASGWHTLTHGDVEINVVPEGGKARDASPTTIPGPERLGVKEGLDYASLSGWIELKLSSGRAKDRAHVVEAMKRAKQEDLDDARRHVASVHRTYLALFDELIVQASEERRQEDERR